MKKKSVDFEEVYDLFAVRIILDVPLEQEKPECWKVYSIVTDFYKPNPDRLRDWISTPKGNGYESLHTTVMSPTGKWVEVQIRTKRMNEVAEKGYAAHWKYKENKEGNEGNLDLWLGQIREVLENPEENAIQFIDDFKMNLFAEEIFVFTPNGDVRSLPVGATALDFAFDIHSQVGERCLGAKVNHRLMPLSHQLKSGDQVEIITSDKQRPKEDWMNFVVTHRAKAKIKSALKEEKKQIASDGKEILQRKMRNLKINFTGENINELLTYYKVVSALELYYRIAKGNIDLKKLKISNFNLDNGNITIKSEPEKREKKDVQQIISSIGGKTDSLLIGDNSETLDYTLAPCCQPIPGDEVFGFITINDGIKIHRTSCPNATAMMSNYAYRIVKARWSSQELIEFKAGIRFSGIDDMGLVNKITGVISSEQHLNMRAISFESKDGIFEGQVTVNVHDVDHLNQLIHKLLDIEGVKSVERMTEQEEF